MATQTCDCLIHAKWIVPIIPQNQVFNDCSIAIHGQKIIALLPTSEAKKRFDAKEVFELNEHIVMPGLINTHGHAAMSLLRGYADDLPLDTWLNEHIWPAEGQHVSSQFVKEGAQLAIAEMIRSGTTYFSDMYFFPEETAAAAFDAGIRCQINFPILEFPSSWAESADEYLTKGLALRDQYRSNDLMSVDFGPHAPYTVGDETFKRIATLAPELQAGVQVHLHETQFEVEQSLKEHGKRPIQRLFDLNILTPLTQCVHMTALNGEDIALIQRSGAHVNAATLNAHQALEMATINGARAMNQEDITGSLEVGKSADMIAIKIDPLEQMPLYNPLSQLVYTHNGHRVSHNWVQGKCLMKDRMLTTLNEREIIANTAKWQEVIK